MAAREGAKSSLCAGLGTSSLPANVASVPSFVAICSGVISKGDAFEMLLSAVVKGFDCREGAAGARSGGRMLGIAGVIAAGLVC